MPLELLAEILSYAQSTREILSLARTSKHFCNILVNNKSTNFIWRQVRAQAYPNRIPDFTANFTEASFAAFLFDSKICEVCQKKTRDVYHSFALRGAICDKPTCLFTWQQQVLYWITPTDEVEYPEFSHWIPRLERGDGMYAGKVYVRKSDWQAAINEHKKVHLLGGAALEAYIKKTQALADALPAQIEFYKMLREWGRTYEIIRKHIHKTNNELAQLLAKENGWSILDLLHAPSYSAIHNTKNRSLASVTRVDFDAVKGRVKEEIVENKEREARREREHDLKDRLEKVKATWTDLKDGCSTQDAPPPPMPHVQEFRQLPVVKIYQKPEATGSKNLTDPFVKSVLAENLDQWRNAARAGLATVLGFPGWKTMSKKKLHPVDRLTARFRCQRCDRVATENKTVLLDGGMGFAEACEHVCGHLKKKQRGKNRWSAERFVPDQRAIDAVSQVLELCGTSSADVDSVRVAEEVGDRVECQSCHCIMDVRSVARHCKRHDDCSFTLLPADAPGLRPVEHGLTKKLMASSSEAARLRDLKAFGCRHCERSAAEAVAGHQNKMFSFNGLRSHVKEKHSIARIADEDFYQQKDAAAAADAGTK
ncbi:hypothetical protein GSI_14756 [Ganoderma sinense ZZ0214-1]|uniref:F-box domain-containing protein n=1 Tax=Ganoderma sinense ZZ0214-1 TaxID=1077348 RepID=A0A2G8RPJ7_9APHY|nr:hypothetical protein GSI_14756 [Ganoderma sinense ZZ0214-1]